MDLSQHNAIVNLIWGIADDCLRDVYVRGKYRDVILPMTVIRRLDAVLEPTKEKVLQLKAQLDKSKVTNQHPALCQASGQAFYNTSPFLLKDLKSRAKQKQLKADFEAYLDGFSPNVQEILEKFKFRNQIPTMIDADILGSIIEKFTNTEVNLSPYPVQDSGGRERLPGLDNHSMGTVFEELIRRFNEENNEEAGEHFTPRDVVRLMTKLMFEPVADKIESGTYLVYDGACGTGGMLSLAEETLLEIAAKHKKDVSIHLFGQEINPETYAISKADLIIKGEGVEAENMKFGSTLSSDGFPSREFDFMLSNPPYGKSWKTDMERMGGKSEITDHRFIIPFKNDPEFRMIPRSSDGQMLFLVNKISKMKDSTQMGSRIAHIHNGSSLFTGDAGQGESNIRRWIIENDWLEAIVALPENMFYNTGIATYVWVISNKKSKARKGKVQLVDATSWFVPLRKNLGKKNCELSEEQITTIVDLILKPRETEQSKIFPNEAFGYSKIRVERPLRLSSQLSNKLIMPLRFSSSDGDIRKKCYDQFGDTIRTSFKSIKKEMEAFIDSLFAADSDDETNASKAAKKIEKIKKKVMDPDTWKCDFALYDTAMSLKAELGETVFNDFSDFRLRVETAVGKLKLKIGKSEINKILDAVSWQNDEAVPVVKKVLKHGKADPLHGLFEQVIDGKSCLVEFEPDTNLRDSEQVPLLEEGGIEAFFTREVQPYVPDAWIDAAKTQIGYEISFTRYFYKPVQMRSLDEIMADIRTLEKESDGLLNEIVGESK